MSHNSSKDPLPLFTTVKVGVIELSHPILVIPLSRNNVMTGYDRQGADDYPFSADELAYLDMSA
jgi:hypothetical protein